MREKSETFSHKLPEWLDKFASEFDPEGTEPDTNGLAFNTIQPDPLLQTNNPYYPNQSQDNSTNNSGPIGIPTTETTTVQDVQNVTEEDSNLSDNGNKTNIFTQ